MLSAKSDIQDALVEFNMIECDGADTPLAHNSFKDCPTIGSDEWHKMQKIPYRSCVCMQTCFYHAKRSS